MTKITVIKPEFDLDANIAYINDTDDIMDLGARLGYKMVKSATVEITDEEIEAEYKSNLPTTYQNEVQNCNDWELGFKAAIDYIKSRLSPTKIMSDATTR